MGEQMFHFPGEKGFAHVEKKIAAKGCNKKIGEIRFPVIRFEGNETYCAHPINEHEWIYSVDEKTFRRIPQIHKVRMIFYL